MRIRSCTDAATMASAFFTNTVLASPAERALVRAWSDTNAQPTRRSRRSTVSSSSSPIKRAIVDSFTSVRRARHATERENAMYEAGGSCEPEDCNELHT